MNKSKLNSGFFIRLGITALLALSIVLGSSDFSFFWDTIQLGAKQGDFFFQNNFSYFLLPDRIDSGHVPAFGAWLAVCWKLFGQNLLVSHLAMLPFLWLLFYQLSKWLQYIGNSFRYWPLLFLLFVIDPVMAGQLVLVSPDVALMAFFVLALNSIHSKKRNFLVVSIIALGFISMRGVMVAMSLFIWQSLVESIVYNRKNIKNYLSLLLPYLPGGLIVIAYLAYHYYVKGWIGVHSDSPWASSFSLNEPSLLLKQVAVLGWRLLDFGRVFLFLVLGIMIGFYWWEKDKIKAHTVLQDQFFRKLLLLNAVLLVVLGLPAILSAGLSQHRYLLPLFFSLTSLFVYWIVRANWLMELKKLTLIGLLLIGLLMGNRWIYPDHISQGWDATLAHLPYYEGRREALDFLKNNTIELSKVGTVFPEIGPIHYRELNNDRNGMKAADFDTDAFVFYSNIMNDFSDEQLIELKNTTQWELVFNYQKAGVKVQIFQKTTPPAS